MTADDLSEWLFLAATENGFAESYLLGDADLNGTIGASDLNQVALNWRGSADKWSDGDFDADAMVDADDLNSLALNWGASIRVTASAVPEPSSEWLLALSVFLVSAFRTKKGFERACHSRRPLPSSF